jgi:hypothetical protein
MAESKDANAAIYVPWNTVRNAVEQLTRHGLPNRLDRTVFPGMAWSVQTQLLSGLKFLALTDESGKPTNLLDRLVEPSLDEAGQKAVWLEVLKNAYSDLFALDLKRTTPSELDQKMSASYGVSGSTKQKAIRFFVAAAEYSGVDLSPLLAANKRAGRPASVNGTRAATASAHAPRKRTGKGSGGDVTGSAPTTIPLGDSKTIQLASGGTLTLYAAVDLFTLSIEDRKFVFELIDKLESYGTKNAT